MTPEQFRALVDVSASLLLFAHFVLYVGVSVALYIVWQAIRMARQEMPTIAREVAQAMIEVEGVTYERADAVITPQIRVASAWVGVRAGVRALMGKTRPQAVHRPDESAPPL